MLKSVQEKLSQEVSEFNAQSHNEEILKDLEKLVSMINQKIPSHRKIEPWRAICFILDGNISQPRFYHEHCQKKSSDLLDSKRKKKNKKIIYAQRPRKNVSSQFLIDNINMFGSLGGFDYIFSAISQPETAVEEIILIIRLLHGCRMFLVTEIGTQILKHSQLIFSKFINLHGQALKDTSNDVLKLGISQLYSITTHFSSSPPQKQRHENFRFEAATNFISSPFLNKQVLGLNMLIEMLELADQQGGSLTPEILSGWIIQKSLVRQILGKPNHLHSEIAQRSVKLISFLLKHDKLRSNHVKWIWNLAISGAHSSMTEHFDSMLHQIFDVWPPDKLRQLHILNDLPLHNIRPPHLQLIFHLANNILKKEPPNSQESVEGVTLLWRCIQDDNFSIPIKKDAIRLLSDLMQTPYGRRCRRHYLLECTRYICNGGSTSFVHAFLSFLQTFTLSSKSYANLSRSNHASNLDASLNATLEELNSGGLTDALVRQILEKAQNENVQIDPIQRRLQLLTFLAHHSTACLDLKQMNALLELLLRCPTHLRQPLVSWMNGVAESLPSKHSMLEPQTAKFFFAEKLCTLDVTTMQEHTYTMFERFFLRINRCFQHLARFDSPQHVIVLRMSTPQLPSNCLEGFTQLWSIAMQCASNVVAERAIFLIVQLHRQLHQQISEQAKPVRERLISGCLEYISKDGGSSIQTRRALLLLRKFIYAFKSQRQLKNDAGLRDVLLNISVKSTAKNNSSQPTRREIQVTTLMKIGELRSMLASEHKHHRNKIELQINQHIADADDMRLAQYVKRNRSEPVEVQALLQSSKWFHTREKKKDPNTPALLFKGNSKWFKCIFDMMKSADTVSASLAYDIACILEPPPKVIDFLITRWQKLLEDASCIQVLYCADILWDILCPKRAVFQRTEKDTKIDQVVDHYRTQGGFEFLYRAFMNEVGWEKPKCPFSNFTYNRCLLKIMRLLKLKIPHPDKADRQISILNLVVPSNKREETFVRLVDVISSASRAFPSTSHSSVHSTNHLNVLETIHDVIHEGFLMMSQLLNLHPTIISCFKNEHVDRQIEVLIKSSLLEAENCYIRKSIKTGIMTICTQFKADNMMNPSDYFRTKLIAALDMIQNSRSNGEYFNLMQSLFEKSSTLETPSLDQVHELIERLTALIINHAPETPDNTEDNTLLGLLELTRILVEVMNRENSSIKNKVAVQLSGDLFNSCLFHNGESLTEDVWPVKCKSTQSRAAAFSLLEAVTKNCPQSMSELMNYMDHFLQLESDAYWWSNESATEMKTTRYVGLRNLGNTCYLNCIIQQLFCLDAFSDTVLELTEKADDLADSPFFGLQNVFQCLRMSHKKFHDPEAFVRKLKDGNNQPIDVSVQTDLHEFLMSIFTQLTERMKNTEEPELVSKLFEGKQTVEIVTEQGNRKTLTQDFTHIQVHVKDISSLEQGLDLLCKEENIPDYRCSVTGDTVSAMQTSSFEVLPPVLIFCLSRFDYSVEHVRSVKLNHYVSFPDELDMSKYRQPESHNPELDEYTLVGVVIHSGEPNRGHYYSFIKDNVENDEWYRFDDEKVLPFDSDNLNTEAFGGEEDKNLSFGDRQRSMRPSGPEMGDKERNAYLLFYVRSSMLHQVKNSSFAKKKFAPYLIPNISSLRNQNLRLFRDASIVDPRFHKFCESIFRNNTNHTGKFGVYLRFVFNVICKMNKTAKDLKPWFKFLSDAFSHPQACHWLLQRLSQEPQSKWLEELLISSKQPSVRSKMSKFLGDVCRIWVDGKARGESLDPSVLENFLLCLLQKLDHWKNGEQVFELLFSIMQKNESNKRILIQANALRQLSNCLSRVGTVTWTADRAFPSRKSTADVNQVVVIIDSLLRICNPGELMTKSPFSKCDLDSAFTLEGDDLALVNSREFYNALLAKDVKMDHVVGICSHLSFENQNRFKLIQDIVLERLKWLDFDEWYLGLSVLLSILRVKDSFQQQRVDETLSAVCSIMNEQQFYWKATDVAIFCLLRASKRNDEISNWMSTRLQDAQLSWIDAWLLKKAPNPNNDSETQTMYKTQDFTTDDAIDVKRKKGDNLTNWKRLQRNNRV